MDIKDLKIVPPEGMEYYIDNGEIRFREIKKNLTYDDIARKLFENNRTFYTNVYGEIQSIFKAGKDYGGSNNCTSEKQAQKFLAINKLMNVAKYLNGDWTPNWNESDKKYAFAIRDADSIIITYWHKDNHSLVYFKSEELAKQAIEILGEETIKLALCTDW